MSSSPLIGERDGKKILYLRSKGNEINLYAKVRNTYKNAMEKYDADIKRICQAFDDILVNIRSVVCREAINGENTLMYNIRACVPDEDFRLLLHSDKKDYILDILYKAFDINYFDIELVSDGDIRNTLRSGFDTVQKIPYNCVISWTENSPYGCMLTEKTESLFMSVKVLYEKKDRYKKWVEERGKREEEDIENDLKKYMGEYVLLDLEKSILEKARERISYYTFEMSLDDSMYIFPIYHSGDTPENLINEIIKKTIGYKFTVDTTIIDVNARSCSYYTRIHWYIN